MTRILLNTGFIPLPRTATPQKKHLPKWGIIADRNYDLDGVGASDKRTALHTAVYEDDSESLGILLGQTKINVNVTTTEGNTPFLYAASIGKWSSLDEEGKILWNCKSCEHKTKRKSHMKEYTQIHLPNLGQRCEVCRGLFKNMASLRNHKSLYRH